MNRPLFKKADAVIIALLVILCGGVLLRPRQSGGEVKITENGKTTEVLANSSTYSKRDEFVYVGE